MGEVGKEKCETRSKRKCKTMTKKEVREHKGGSER